MLVLVEGRPISKQSRKGMADNKISNTTPKMRGYSFFILISSSTYIFEASEVTKTYSPNAMNDF